MTAGEMWLGSQRYFTCILHDITARKRAEEVKKKLEDQNRQLQKSESLGRMAGAIAHHFNNQLQAVMMNLELALLDLPPNAGSRENLTNAMNSALKAAEVSTQMLTYLGQTQGKHEPLDLSEVCRSSLPMLRATMPKSVILETELPSPGPIASANANHIQQILTNLVTNAWEGDGRGAIRLTIKAVSAADIPAANRFPVEFRPQQNGYVCLEVADVGCGIMPKDIEKLFEPFFSSKFTGRGLGLPVVLGIVRAHSGVVTVESEPGQGSVFRVFLPLSPEEIHPKAVPAAQRPNMAAGGTVLVVDDESITNRRA
jgi:signal transduction histidine kinase